MSIRPANCKNYCKLPTWGDYHKIICVTAQMTLNNSSNHCNTHLRMCEMGVIAAWLCSWHILSDKFWIMCKAVECELIPFLNHWFTLDQQSIDISFHTWSLLGWHSIDISIDSWLTVGRYLAQYWLTYMYQSTLSWPSTDCWPRCWSSGNTRVIDGRRSYTSVEQIEMLMECRWTLERRCL